MNIDTTHKLFIGDSRDMSAINNNSIHLVITSPPYWQLKDYGSEKQIGFNDSYEEYINNLNLTWLECYRVLDNDCRLCINIGDQYARSVYYGRYKVIPIRTEIIKFCETIGFDYMGAIIWQKVGTMNTTGGAVIMGSYPYPRNGILKLDYEFILIFKKHGKGIRKIPKETKQSSKLTKEEWNQYFTGHWNFAGTKQNKHIAMFPLELPYRLIKMFSFVGDTILDPFLGSGTTSSAALKLNRSSVGYEINSDFVETIKDKINYLPLIIEKQTEIKNSFKERIQRNPYIFEDKIKLDKKMDPRKLQFGSVITDEEGNKEESFTVKKIISPEILLLNNNLKIKLLGVKEDKTKNGKAIKFLEEKLKGKKIFLQYDRQKYDTNNYLMCYVYLKNKTFINAHLLKNHLALVDENSEYKYKNKFLNIMNE